MPKYSTIEEGVTYNQSLRCVWCGDNRDGLSRYCTRCKRGVYRWGHPNGRKLPIQMYSPVEERCKLLLDQNRDKSNVQFALRFFERYLEKASDAGSSWMVANPTNAITELARRGVTAEEMFLRSVAVYAFCTMNRGNAWSSKYQVGGAILTLRYWNRNGEQTRGQHRREVGEFILKALKPVLEQFVYALKRQELYRLEHEEMMSSTELDV